MYQNCWILKLWYQDIGPYIYIYIDPKCWGILHLEIPFRKSYKVLKGFLLDEEKFLFRNFTT